MRSGAPPTYLTNTKVSEKFCGRSVVITFEHALEVIVGGVSGIRASHKNL